MSNYRRHYVPGGTWFFTVNLQNRQSDLLTRHIADLRAATATVKRSKPFTINAWVILPEHMHCIWTLPEGDSDFSARWRDIKKTFSRNIEMRHIWQPRFWEHTIRNEEDHRRHMDYIYINPVKHGYVSNVIDWPFSTFHRDVREDYIQRIGQERSRIFRRENGGKSRVAATPYPAYSWVL
jgi:putative transposase